MGIHFRSDCLRNYYVLTPFGARFWISYCASYHVRCTQTTSGRGSKAASASCASCASCRRSDTWPGRWWHLDKKPVMLGWASWFWTFFLRLNMKNVGSTKIFDLFSLVGFRKMLPFMASLHGFPSKPDAILGFEQKGGCPKMSLLMMANVGQSDLVVPRNLIVKSIIFPMKIAIQNCHSHDPWAEIPIDGEIHVFWLLDLEKNTKNPILCRLIIDIIIAIHLCTWLEIR